MKTKATTKRIIASYYVIASCGYCALSGILANLSPEHYNAGECGWNYDVYNVSGVAVCTGYRSMPGKAYAVQLNRDFCERWNARAEKIAERWATTSDEYASAMTCAQAEMAEEIRNLANA